MILTVSTVRTQGGRESARKASWEQEGGASKLNLELESRSLGLPIHGTTPD